MAVNEAKSLKTQALLLDAPAPLNMWLSVVQGVRVLNGLTSQYLPTERYLEPDI